MSDKRTDPHDLAWKLANRVSDVLARADVLRDTLSLLIATVEKGNIDDATMSWIRYSVKPEIEKFDTIRAKGVRE